MFAVLFFIGFFNFSEASEIRSALDVMTFEDTYQCGGDRKPPESYCQAVEFKAWSEEEKSIVARYLQGINDPRLNSFLKTIKDKGITKLYRVSYVAKYYTNSAKRKVEYFRTTDTPLLQVDPLTQVISFTDDFFDVAEFIDPWAKVDRRQLNVMHELVHVFGTATRSYSPDDQAFKQAVGWAWDGKEWGLRGVSNSQVQKEFASVLALVKKGQPTAGFSLDRELGMKYGFPTIYGMTNNHELFAEILTYYIFDSTAESYLSPQVVQYIESVLQAKP